MEEEEQSGLAWETLAEPLGENWVGIRIISGILTWEGAGRPVRVGEPKRMVGVVGA
jgi:hypothetical protein